MRSTRRCLLVALCLFAPSLTLLRADPVNPSPLPSPTAPPSLDVPATQTLALTLTARGVQIYECRATQADPTKYEWVFEAPEADLFDAQNHQVGRHYAGPTWELTDGDKVVGKLKAKADAPDGKSIPWLLLDTAQSSGPILGKVQSIRRINTSGGKAPTTPPDQTKKGQIIRIDYTAAYQFFVGKP